jgi:hypothetical protein
MRLNLILEHSYDKTKMRQIFILYKWLLSSIRVLNLEKKPHRVKPKTVQLVCVASPLSKQH